MLQSKLIDILRTFTPEEIKDFHLYVSSPFLNKNSSAAKLYGIIKKYGPRFDSTELEKEILFSHMYPGKKYSDSRMRNIISDLMSLAEDFITFRSWSEDTFSFSYYHSKALNARCLDKLFIKDVNSTIEKLSNSRTKDEDFYFNRSLLKEEYLSHLSRDSLFIDSNSFQGYLDDFTNYFIAKIFRIISLMLNERIRFPQYNFTFRFLDRLIEHVNTHNYDGVPIVKIYYNQIMLLLSDEGEKYYSELIKLLSVHGEILNELELRNIYVYLINYWVVKTEAQSENVEYIRKLFELYKIILNKEIYRVREFKFFDHLLYKNIVFTALKLREYQWTENFINTYKDKLSPEHAHNSGYLSFAQFYYYKEEYEKSLEMLARVESKNWWYNLEIKALTLQIYYELNLFDTMMSHIDSYRHYLSNKNITKRVVPLHRNYINFSERLVRIKLRPDEFNTVKLNSEIINSETMNRHWLIEKVKEL